MFGKKQTKNVELKEGMEDWRETYRYGKFDESGYVSPMYVSNSRKEYASLAIPPETKPFKYPVEGGATGYVNVYLCGAKELDKKYSYDGIWLSADLCYRNSELSGSLVGKLSEQYHRIGDIKNKLSGEWSLKANFFLVLMVIFAGLGVFYTIGVRLLAQG